MSTISSFKIRENNYDVCRGKDCMNKIMLLRKEWQESCENAKICYICYKYLKDKKYCKIRDHCHYTGEYRDAAHSICNFKYSVPKRIPLVFHNRSNYDFFLS